MTMQDDTDIAPEAAEYRLAYRFLLDHAGWPTPPSAWAQLFMATAALGEIYDPAPASSEGRKSAAAIRLLIRILDEAFWGSSDTTRIRTFIPLVQGRSQTISAALTVATAKLLDQPARSGPDGATHLLETLREDRMGRMIRGLTQGTGQDAAAQDRPDLAEGLRNPYALADAIDAMRDRIIGRVAEMIRIGDPALRLMDRMAIMVPLAVTSEELRGSGGIALAELRLRMTDLTLMTLLEQLGPNLGEQPGPKQKPVTPATKRRAMVRGNPIVAQTHNPYRLLQQIGFKSTLLGTSLNRIRDHVRSVLAGDIVPMGRRRLPYPADVVALASTLRRIQSGR
jgi:hypothetical protein